MAKQVVTKLLDDLTGEEADESVSFALDGNLYSIDLSGDNALRLRKFLAEFIDSAERVGKVGQAAMLTGYKARPAARGSATTSLYAQRAQNAAIRTWAAENGFELSERGRIAQHVQDAYYNRKTSDARVQQLELETSNPAANKTAAKKAAPKAAFAHA